MCWTIVLFPDPEGAEKMMTLSCICVSKSKKESDMEKDCDEAIKQIIDKKYSAGIDDGFEQILCYGVSFYKKKAKVKLLKQ